MPSSLAKRYVFKLIANMVSIPVYLVMEALLPRALGPQIYGNFSFATTFFQQLSGFLDMGTSTCFYNSLARQPKEIALISFYIRIAIIIGIILLLFALALNWQPAARFFMPDIPVGLILPASLWAYLTWLSRILRSTNDALGITVSSEICRSLLSLAGLALLVFLYITHALNIYTLFLQQYALLISLCAGFGLVCHRYWKNENLSITWPLQKTQTRAYISSFYSYTHPLFTQSLLSFFMIIAERWLLQWLDGSAQQGFYALSQKVGMACFLFVSAMTPLLMREFSVAWSKKDLHLMGKLFSRFAPALYAIAAYFSCFTLIEGKTIVAIFGGEAFAAALLPVQIMALYPLHQTCGQMASSIFHASGKTKILRNLTICECFYGLALTWIMLAPAGWGGFNLGATGLAIKTVFVQFISVNVCVWLASRLVPFSFWKNLAHQFWCFGLMISLAWVSHNLLNNTYPTLSPGWIKLIISGIIYTFSVCVCVIFVPGIFGLTKGQLKEYSRQYAQKLKNISIIFKKP